MIQFCRKFYDFLVVWKAGKRQECPNGATVSMDEFLWAENVPYGYKFADGNVGVTEKKVTLPHYMAMFV